MKVLTVNTQVEARSRRSLRESWFLALTDLMVIAACFLLGRMVHGFVQGVALQDAVAGSSLDYGDERLLLYIGLTLACVLSFRRFGHYARRRPFWQELGDVLGVTLTMAVIDAALVFLTESEFSRFALVANWTLVALLVPLSRVAIKRALMSAGAWRRPTVIVGLGPNALDAAAALASEPLLGLDVIAFVSPPRDEAPMDQSAELPSWVDADDRRLPVLQPGLVPNLLPEYLGRPHVVVALEMDETARCGDFIEQLSLHYGDVDIVSPVRGLPLAGAQVTHFFSHDVLALRLRNNLARPWPKLFKRGLDVVGGALCLLAFSPVFALIAWRVRRAGGNGPVFYGHTRIGQGGRPFKCYKFRSMVANADQILAELLEKDERARAEWEADHKLKDDPRITRIGHWLRRTSLDELPQLWNVLKGDMSLIGPRPIVREELARYGKHQVYYLESKPGMTGLWQISGRSNLDYRRRVHLDCWYVKNWTIWYDVIILLKTAKVVLLRQGAC